MEAKVRAVSRFVFDLTFLLGGAALIGFGSDWRMGLGAGLLALFAKGDSK